MTNHPLKTGATIWARGLLKPSRGNEGAKRKGA